jgi:cystathionine beta-synthase
MARRLVREEGLFCGSSSGAVLKVAIEYAKRENLGADKRIVCLFADNVRNYMTKFLSKEWMVEKELMQPNELVGASHPLRGLPLEKLELQRV